MTGVVGAAKPLPFAVCGVLLLALGAMTWHRAHAYRDVETIWRDTLDRNPSAFIAANNLGAVFLARGDLARAEDLFVQALRTKPDYAEGLDNLGLVAQAQGRTDEAESRFRDALRSDPNFPNAHNNLGTVLGQRGLLAEALEHFDRAIALRPSFAKAHQNRGLVFERTGRTAEAIAAYRESLRYAPDTPAVKRQLAWILATDPDDKIRSGAEAVALSLAASRAANDRDPRSLDVLAAAYAEVGRFDEAVRAEERAIQLAGGSTPAGFTESASMKLALYRSGQPYRRRAP
jgi:tetratricopeptide (TPR) repeat protein